MTMTQRSFMSIRAMALAIAAAAVATVPVTGQESTYTAPRTPDGQPDLQGFWTNQTYSPLERPDDVTKEFYTAEEVAEIESGRAQSEASQTTPGTIPDVHYDFTQFGLDREPVWARPEHANVTDRGSTGWETPAPDGRGRADRRRPRLGP